MNILVLEACYFDIASEKGRNCIPSDCIKKKSFIPVNLWGKDNGAKQICRDLLFGFIMINYL
jgi:hypothetical protein